MSKFEVSQNQSRYRIVGLTAQRYAIPPTSGIAFAEGLLFGLPGGTLLALPVALRANGAPNQFVFLWLGAAGLYGMALGLLTAALRISRPLPRKSPALPVGLGLAAGPLSLLGSQLHAQTHHRPLGAATFAVLAAILCTLAWALAARILHNLRSPYPRRRKMGWLLAIPSGVVSIACLGPMAHAWLLHFGDFRLLSSGVIDGLLGLSLAVFGGFARYPLRMEAIARTAGPLAFGVCVLTFVVAVQTPHIAPLLEHASLLYAFLR